MTSGTTDQRLVKITCPDCGTEYTQGADVPPPRGCEHCGGKKLDMVAVDPVCDFCTGSLAGKPCYNYECEDFSQGVVIIGPDQSTEHVSVGDWTACEGCHPLVEAENTVALAERSTDAAIERGEVPEDLRETVVNLVRRAQADFFDHKTDRAPEREACCEV